MPLYKYECPACQGEHEELKKVADRAEDVCPACGATAKLVIVPVHLDYLNCGWDLSLPTAASKWDRLHAKGAKTEPR